MTMKKRFLCFAATLLLAACEDAVKLRPHYWTYAGGVEWSEKTDEMMDWYEAEAYCGSIEGRLPTIDELKKLVPHCKNYAPGGSCRLSDPECLTLACLESGCSCEMISEIKDVLGDDSDTSLWSSSVLRSDDRYVISLSVSWGIELLFRTQERFVRCVKLTPEEINDTEKPDDITEYGLFWSERSSYFMAWQEAVGYCEVLEEGEYADWRLPTINELRTIIINCPDTMPEGACKVSDPDCLIEDCHWEKCSCNGDGDSFSALGDGSIRTLWSSSFSPSPFYSSHAWVVSFAHDSIYSSDKDNYESVRCVRTPSYSNEQTKRQ